MTNNSGSFTTVHPQSSARGIIMCRVTGRNKSRTRYSLGLMKIPPIAEKE
jgi:hypothetical protein